MELKETTSTAGVGGQYETPFPTDNLSNKAEDEIFTEADINRMTKQALVESFVIESDPSLFGKGRENVEGIETFHKPNMGDKNTGYENINVAQTDDIRIEAHQNGLLDTEYDSLPKKAAENMKNAVLQSDKAVGNGIPSKTGKQMLDDAKKRNNSRLQQDYKGTFSDVEIDKSNPDNNRKSIVEQKTMKKLIYPNNVFKTEQQLLEHLEATLKAPFKEEGKQFFVESMDSTLYKVIWENGEPNIIGSKNVIKEAANMEKVRHTMNYDTSSSNVVSSKIDENDFFMKFHKQTKQHK